MYPLRVGFGPFKARKFPPLKADSPAIGALCPSCEQPILSEQITTLIPFEIVSRHMAAAAPMHWQCLEEMCRGED